VKEDGRSRQQKEEGRKRADGEYKYNRT